MILQLNHAWIENQIIPDGKTHFNNGDKAPVSKGSERSEARFSVPSAASPSLPLVQI